MTIRGSSCGEIRDRMRMQGFATTTWQELGLELDCGLVESLLRNTEKDPVRRLSNAEYGDNTVSYNDTKECRDAARMLAEPVVERLTDLSGRQGQWNLFGINYYRQGDFFPPHRDFNNPEIASTVILSLSGIRCLRIEGGESLRLEPGQVTLLDGARNLQHSAFCIEGPSVSVVVDVKALLY